MVKHCNWRTATLATLMSMFSISQGWSETMPGLPSSLRLESNTMTGSIPVRINYLLYLPVGYEDRSQWPLILFLHGAGERGDNLSLVATHGPPKVAQALQLPFVIVAPQCPAGVGWDARELSALLDDVESSYRIDKDRIYVTGLSMGGFGTWSLGFLVPDRLAALAHLWRGGATVCPPSQGRSHLGFSRGRRSRRPTRPLGADAAGGSSDWRAHAANHLSGSRARQLEPDLRESRLLRMAAKPSPVGSGGCRLTITYPS